MSNLANTGTSTSDTTGPLIELGTIAHPAEPILPNVPGDGTVTIAELKKALDGTDFYERIKATHKFPGAALS